jgi:hypothetical protein
LIVINILVMLFGLAMFVYWGMYLVQGLPTVGVPVLSEIVTAILAMCSAYGLFRLRSWSVASSLVLAGMWAYGVIGGIQLVFDHGLDFSSPFGALTDALLFPLVLIFAVSMAVYLWRHRKLFL